MIVPFGFSVGDFCALAKVLKDAAEALKQTGGAASSYQAVKIQFETCSKILQEIEQLKPLEQDVADINAVKGFAQGLNSTLSSFSSKIVKYEKHLGTSALVGARHGSIAKVKWATLVEKEVISFQQQLNYQVPTLLALMEVVSQKQRIRSRSDYQSLDLAIRSTATSLENRLCDKLEQTLRTQLLAIISKLEENRPLLSQPLQASQSSSDTENAAIVEMINTAEEKVSAKLDQSSSEMGATDHTLAVSNEAARDLQVEESSDVAESEKFNHIAMSLTEMEIGTFSREHDLLHILLQRMIDIIRGLLLLILRSILVLWPKLLVFIRRMPIRPRSIYIAQQDCIFLKDILGRSHYLEMKYFHQWDALILALRCAFKGLPGYKRVLDGKFMIMNQSRLLLNANNWHSHAKPKSHLTMVVALDYLRIQGRDGGVDQRCPITRCSGLLKTIDEFSSLCIKCGKTFGEYDAVPLKPQESISIGSMHADYRTPMPRSEKLADLVFHSNHLAFEKILRSEEPFQSGHDLFQKFRRENAERFLEHSEKRVLQIEDLRDEFARIRTITTSSWISPQHTSELSQNSSTLLRWLGASSRTRSQRPASDARISSNQCKLKQTSKGLRPKRTYLADVTSTVTTTQKNLIIYNSEKILRKKEQDEFSRNLEEDEIEPYRYIQLAPTIPERDDELVHGIKAQNAYKVAQALFARDDINAMTSYAPLHYATIVRNGIFVDLQLELGANPLLKDETGLTSMIAAATSGDLSILLSMLSAIDSLWAAHLGTSFMPITHQQLLYGMHTAFLAAVHNHHTAAVELFLFFGFDPFLRLPSQGDHLPQSGFEVAAALGLEDLISSFLVQAVEERRLSHRDACEIVKTVNSANHTGLIIFPIKKRKIKRQLVDWSLHPNVLFQRAMGPENGFKRSILHFVEHEQGHFTHYFMHSPLAILARTRRDPNQSLSIEHDLVGSLLKFRAYFANYQTGAFPLIERILQFFDRTLEAINEVRNGSPGYLNIVDCIMRNCCKHTSSNRLFDSVESIKMVLLAVDPGYPFAPLISLSKDAYWRLQPGGFIFIMNVLTDIKRLMRNLNKELRPMWKHLQQSRKRRHKMTPQFTFNYHFKTSVLLDEGQSYTILLDGQGHNPGSDGLSKVTIRIFTPERKTTLEQVEEMKVRSALFKELNKLRVEPDEVESEDEVEIVYEDIGSCRSLMEDHQRTSN